MKKYFNSIYVLEIVVVLMTVFGFLPRTVVPYFFGALAVYLLSIPVEDGIIFFIRSIPFFLAIPITANFDSLNAWRIISIVIFFKWLNRQRIEDFLRISKDRKVFNSLMALMIIAVLSVFVAANPMQSLRRIIYFSNLSLAGIVLFDLMKNGKISGQKVIKNIAYPVIIVTILGFVQLAMTYFMDIYKFIDFWGKTVELNLFGQAWSSISLRANTWFAYFGEQLSLRMFSIFPDSHSFPIFLLLGLPSLLAISLTGVIKKSSSGLKAMVSTRASLRVVFVVLAMLAAILSGTRGIWAAAIAVLALNLGLILYFKKTGIKSEKRNIFKYLASYLAVFFLLFSVALPILASPQFLVAKDNTGILASRFKSIIDSGETSNKRRLQIWRASLESIIKKPILGVGIGNFPVVVGEDLALAKAGSTAHNLYLHIAAEMGIPALIIALYFIWLLFKKILENFLDSEDNFLSLYYGACLIFVPWVFIYSFTDPAIFDERAFLIFTVTCSLIFTNKQ